MLNINTSGNYESLNSQKKGNITYYLPGILNKYNKSVMLPGEINRKYGSE